MKKSMKVNAVLNLIKQALSILFPLITIPYVSRTLGAENYGKISFSNSVVSYFILIAALGISTYAIREGARVRDDKEKLSKFQNEVFTINVYSMVFSYALLLILLLFASSLKEYRLLMIVQSSAILFSTLGCDWINTIHEDFLYITIRYIIVQILCILSLFLFVKNPQDYIIYAIISVFSSVGANIFNIIYIYRKYGRVRFVKNCNFATHIKPILLLFFNAIAVTVYVNSDSIIFGLFIGNVAVGIYNIAAKLYTVVKQILITVISIALPRFSAYFGREDQSAYFILLNKVFEAQIIILFPCVAGLFMLSKEIILLVAGEAYVAGYVALKILSISLAFAVLASFFCNCVLLPQKKEKVCLIASVISAAVNLLLNFIAIPLFGYNGAASTTLLSECIVFMIYVAESRKLCTIRKPKKTICATAIGCFAICAVCFLCKTMISSNIVIIITSVVLSGLAYLITLIAFRNSIVMDTLNKLRRKI